MHDGMTMSLAPLLAASPLSAVWNALWPYLVIFAGFSAVIFVHELGHFLAAKWAGVRVERFAIGFFREIFGFTKGETRYSLNILPLGGYVKMLGQEDFDDKSEELRFKDDPRAFTNKPVGKRMVIVTAGVVMNVIFAALLFVIVFMYGTQENVTTIGQVVPESPAAKAGLMPGDTILTIDGREIREYQEVRFAIILADPHKPVDFVVDRGGERKTLTVIPEPDDRKNLLQVGIMPATEPVIAALLSHQYDAANPRHVRPGDRVIAVRGQPIEESYRKTGIEQLLRSADGSPVPVTVERPIKEGDPKGPTETVEALVFNEMFIYPSEIGDESASRNVLGLIPLVRVTDVDPKGRAALGGLQENDVVIQWGEHVYPTQKQITDSIRNSPQYPGEQRRSSWRTRFYDWWAWDPERSIAVRIERGSQRERMWLEITPKVGERSASPSVGFRWLAIADDNLLVAGVVEKIHDRPTPALESGIPAGAVIQEVNGETINRWHQLVEAFRRHAGQSVTISYEAPDKRLATCGFRVPQCLDTELGLTTLANVVAVDGEQFVTLQGLERQVKVSAGFPYGLYKLLSQRIEANNGLPTTVAVRYQEQPYGPEHETQVTITPEVIDPWLGRIEYAPTVFMQLQTQLLKGDGPLDALVIGVKKTVYFVLQVYTMMERMIVSRSVGVEHMSGPVGIVKMGGDVARMGFISLLFFLAIISANLAVINFLPLPIMDGGLMVFLIIEKIKGSPVSLKVQVVTQMLGLVLIGAAFLFVTFNDVIRWAG